jgi:hypothetical protein
LNKKNNLKKAYRLKGSEDPINDSGARSTCSGKVDILEVWKQSRNCWKVH